MAKAVAMTLGTAGVDMCFSSFAPGYIVTHHSCAGGHPWCWLCLDQDVLVRLRQDHDDLSHFRPNIPMSAETIYFLYVFHREVGDSSESVLVGLPVNPKEEQGFLWEAPLGSNLPSTPRSKTG